MCRAAEASARRRLTSWLLSGTGNRRIYGGCKPPILSATPGAKQSTLVRGCHAIPSTIESLAAGGMIRENFHPAASNNRRNSGSVRFASAGENQLLQVQKFSRREVAGNIRTVHDPQNAKVAGGSCFGAVGIRVVNRNLLL